METSLNYLVLEVRADHGYEMFMELIEMGLPSLCVTTTYPEKLERMFPPMENAITVWVSSEGKGEGGFYGKEMNSSILHRIQDFTRKNDGAAVMIDDIEYLILENSEDDALDFVRKVSRAVATADGTLVVPINPDAVSEDFVKRMSRIFDVIDDRTGEKKEGTVICPECGAEWPAGITVCTLCGYRFPVLKDVEVGDGAEPLTKEKNRDVESIEAGRPTESARIQDNWLSRGVSYELQGQSYKAIECFDRAIAENPRDAWAYINKGVSLQRLNRLEDALKAYNRAIELNPDDPDAWNNQGTVKRALGDLKGAIEAYERALNINPEDAGIWSNLGITRRASGDMNGALEAYENALKLNPYDTSIWLNKGALLQAEGKLKNALECYEKVLELEPNNETAQRKKRAILLRLGRR